MYAAGETRAFPNGREVDHPHYAYKLQWFEALKAAVAGDAAGSRPFAVMGDSEYHKGARSMRRAFLAATLTLLIGVGSLLAFEVPGTLKKIDVDFLSGPKPTGTFREPSSELVVEKKHFGASRRARWFG